MEYLNIKAQTIVVIGDIMLDVQIYGKIEKMANEAPIPVLHSECEKKQLGGSGNVLMNLQALGCNRLFVLSMVGNDGPGKEIQSILSSYSEIVPYMCVSNEYCTTVKTRGFADKKIIFRYDVEKKQPLSDIHINYCKASIDQILHDNRVDSIILSDYNKGFMMKELTEYVIFKANTYNIPTFVDPKIDHRKYKNCTVFKPNIKEIKDIFGLTYSYDRLQIIHETIQKEVQCKETLLTLSENGISYFTTNGKMIHKKTVSTEVCDVTGAGDIVLSVIAYYYNHIERENLVQLATWMGTQSVKHVGTYIMKKRDILQAYKRIRGTKLITAANLIHLDAPCIVTNGCFDIVHEGHIELFKYCKMNVPENGDVVIALNGDESIRRLKGSTRPINLLQSRIALLNEVESIDWIVVFNDDTPYELYKEIRPDILVKGGDYSIDSIVGKEFCREIKIFNFISGQIMLNNRHD